jgi:hypothetical protein
MLTLHAARVTGKRSTLASAAYGVALANGFPQTARQTRDRLNQPPHLVRLGQVLLRAQ